MLITVPFISSAESGLTERDVNIELNPAIPVPHKNVTATLTSYTTDLNKALIEWKDASNNVLLSGTGEKSYTVNAGEPNSDINIQVHITPFGDSNPIVKQLFIHPADVDILWQIDDAYTPPFYKGKALPTSESIIRAVAMPNAGASSTKSNIVYIWKLEHNTISKSSGYGKDSFIFKNSYLRDVEHIEVNASSVNSSYSATNNVTIPIGSANILFYLKNSDGVVEYNKAITANTTISSDESTIVAEPYFFPIKSGAGNLVYSWKINGESINTPRNPLSLTIRPASTGGYATISLSIENVAKLFQNVSANLRINL
jgi:hypothetical protein